MAFSGPWLRRLRAFRPTPPPADPPESKALIDPDTAEVLRRINAVSPYEVPDLRLKRDQNFGQHAVDIEALRRH